MTLDFVDMPQRLAERFGTPAVSAAFTSIQAERRARNTVDITVGRIFESHCQALAVSSDGRLNAYTFHPGRICLSCRQSLAGQRSDNLCRACLRPTIESLPMPWPGIAATAVGMAIAAEIHTVLKTATGLAIDRPSPAVLLDDVVPSEHRLEFWEACSEHFGAALPALQCRPQTRERLAAAARMLVGPAVLCLLAALITKMTERATAAVTAQAVAAGWLAGIGALLLLAAAVVSGLHTVTERQFPPPVATMEDLIAFVVASRGQLGDMSSVAGPDAATLVWLHVRHCVAATLGLPEQDVTPDAWLIEDYGFFA